MKNLDIQTDSASLSICSGQECRTPWPDIMVQFGPGLTVTRKAPWQGCLWKFRGFWAHPYCIYCFIQLQYL